MILPAYEAKVIFSNIDQIVSASEALLRDLEEKPNGEDVGDVCLRHVRDVLRDVVTDM